MFFESFIQGMIGGACRRRLKPVRLYHPTELPSRSPPPAERRQLVRMPTDRIVGIDLEPRTPRGLHAGRLCRDSGRRRPELVPSVVALDQHGQIIVGALLEIPH
jgi:hypothetical protein